MQHGAYARRNAEHKKRQAERLAQAASGWEELEVTYDGLRAALRLMQRRRPPLGTPHGTHETQAEQLAREAAEYLKSLYRRIDQGAYDAERQVA
jgi:hypothetical protein